MHLTSLATASLFGAITIAAKLPCAPDFGIPISNVESDPNPIGTKYPTSVTGTINGTISVVPIPYAEARSIIPSQYGILTAAYEKALPGFPRGFYPMIVRSILDHDVGMDGTQVVPDFQANLLGDGYSAFAYEKYLLVTATNLIAQAGIAAYGEIPVPATFQPPNNAYAFTKGTECGEIFLNAYNNLSTCAVVTTRYEPQPAIGPWSLGFFVNVTNQPIFSDGKKCDQQITFFNTSVSTGNKSPVGIKGDVFVAAPYVAHDSFYKSVYGLKVDVAFIENNLLDCQTLKGQLRRDRDSEDGVRRSSRMSQELNVLKL